MAEQELINALSDCMDRIAAGESVEQCLRDYPQAAAKLRPLLDTGALVYRAQKMPQEVIEAQNEVREQVTLAMVERKRKSARRSWFAPLIAVASFTLIIGFASLVFLALTPRAMNELELISTQLLVANSTTFADATGTAEELFEIAASGLPPSATMAPMMSQTPQPSATALDADQIMGTMVTPAALPTTVPDLGIIPATSVYSMSPEAIIELSDVQTTATALAENFFASGTPPLDIGGGLPASTGVAGVGLIVEPNTAIPSGLIAATGVAFATSLPASPPPTNAQQITQMQTPPPLNAGAINDNLQWDDYLLFRNNYLQMYGTNEVHNVEVIGRQTIRVMDEQGNPVLGARVQVYVGQTLVSSTLTYASGETLFFPNAQANTQGVDSFSVTVNKVYATAVFTMDVDQASVWDVTLENAPESDRVQVDVLFLLDATGSMEDEIGELQQNLLWISQQIDALNVDVRYGLVTYRDRGDSYITSVTEFTPDVTAFQAELNRVQAGGGGDEPESLNEGLHNALHNVEWRGADTIKLVFLVADAPPHLDYPNDYDYAQEMVYAAENGIKIHSIAASSLNPTGEYIFRQISQYTMGQFIFLTYAQGNAGTPGEERPDLNVGEPSLPQEQDTGDYTVEELDDLVLDLIRAEIAALEGQ